MKRLWEPSTLRKQSKQLSMNDQRRRLWRWPTLREAITSNQRIFLFMHARLLHDNYYKYRWVHAANDAIGLSWTSMSLVESSGCSKLVDHIQKRCAESHYYEFIEGDLFLTWGLCVEHLADLCNRYVDEVLTGVLNTYSNSFGWHRELLIVINYQPRGQQSRLDIVKRCRDQPFAL